MTISSKVSEINRSSFQPCPTLPHPKHWARFALPNLRSIFSIVGKVGWFKRSGTAWREPGFLFSLPLLLVVGCASAPPPPPLEPRPVQEQQAAPAKPAPAPTKQAAPAEPAPPAIVNDAECDAFRVKLPPVGVLYFTGISEWRNNLDRTKTLALGSAQEQLAQTLQAQVSRQCFERSTSTTEREHTRESLRQHCETVVSTVGVEVGPLSGRARYCTKIKTYELGGRRNTVYQSAARLEVGELRFDAVSAELASRPLPAQESRADEAKTRPPLPEDDALEGGSVKGGAAPLETPYASITPSPQLVPAPVPEAEPSLCPGETPDVPWWRSDAGPCMEDGEYLFFGGAIKKKGGWPRNVLRRVAEEDAKARLAEYLGTVVETRYSEKVVCNSGMECREEAVSTLVTCAMLKIRGRDYKSVAEHEENEWFHVRIRLERAYVEQRLEEALEAGACFLNKP